MGNVNIFIKAVTLTSLISWVNTPTIMCNIANIVSGIICNTCNNNNNNNNNKI